MASSPVDLSGWWELTNQIDATSYEAYRGLRLSYRIFLRQVGQHLAGQGQKWLENGKKLPPAQQTQITLQGSIEGSAVQIAFTEHGTRRTSGGRLRWLLSLDQRQLQGNFASTAADTSGSSIAHRLP